MAKRDKEVITIGSAKLYMMLFEDTMPTREELFTEGNRKGYIKSGAAVEYVEEPHEEKDDLGYISKLVTLAEEALVKCGLIAWNGDTLPYLIDRCKVVTEGGFRRVKIGGAGNAQGKYYAIGLWHEDKQDGDVFVIVKGRNTKGLTLTYATDNGTLIEPEFKAMPQDGDGTLIDYYEEIGTGA